MRLLIDQGNTRIKWRLESDDKTIRGALYNNSDWQVWLEGLRLEVQSGQKINTVTIGSVAGMEFQQRFTEAFNTTFGLIPRFVYSEARRKINGVELTNSYDNPKTMGVDRWLALVAAMAEYPGQNVVIVDAGSAITVEVLSHEGVHQGGYIVPGLDMMQASLLKNTAKVVSDGAQNVIIAPGKCTSDAVNNGVGVAVLGMIEHVLQYAKAMYPKNRVIHIMTGGDAPRLMPFLKGAIHRPELVLDGLSVVDIGFAADSG